MRRSEQREHIFKLLFMTQFNTENEMPEQLSIYFEGLGEVSEKDQEAIQQKYDHILEHLEAEGASPNPTTVYRYLDKLAGEQRIMKYVADKGEKAVFQYVDEGRHCREHLHLKCVQCGRIYHLDCHFMDEVRAHLMAEHGFTLQCEGSVLYGLCRSCAQNSPHPGQTAQKCEHCVDTDKEP